MKENVVEAPDHLKPYYAYIPQSESFHGFNTQEEANLFAIVLGPEYGLRYVLQTINVYDDTSVSNDIFRGDNSK